MLEQNTFDVLIKILRRSQQGRATSTIERDSSFDKYRIQQKLLNALSALNTQLKLDHLLPAILDTTLDLTGAERACFLLYGDDGHLCVKVARNRYKQNVSPDSIWVSQTIIGRALREKAPVYIPCIAEDKEVYAAESIRERNLKSAICFPLLRHNYNQMLLGVIYIDSSFLVNRLREEHINFLQLLVDHIAIYVENARLFEELEETNKQLEQMNQEILTLNSELRHRLKEQDQKFIEVVFEDGRANAAGAAASIIGQSRAMTDVVQLLDHVVGTDATVLITGESGTGKDLIARHIHNTGPRSSTQFISVNCSAFTETLLETELFGHHRGAFTGAHERKKGLFQIADGATLFLDEVGEMSCNMQKKLLRVLEHGEVWPVGAKESICVDVRIIAATNKDLRALVRSGNFRADLYFRLNVIHVHLPALRERREDIPLLVEYYARKIANELGMPKKTIHPDIMDYLSSHDWPGNVRELINELRRIFILGSHYRHARTWPSAASQPCSESVVELQAVEKDSILRALKLAGDNRTKAASLLGLPRRTFYSRLKKHGLL